jgi:hypothetical protein
MVIQHYVMVIQEEEEGTMVALGENKLEQIVI